jgi:hypothetical protein
MPNGVLGSGLIRHVQEHTTAGPEDPVHQGVFQQFVEATEEALAVSSVVEDVSWDDQLSFELP